MTINQAKRSLLVAGASSDIAKACSRRFAEHGWDVWLAGRDVEHLRIEARDLELRYPGCQAAVRTLDILDAASFPAFLDGLPAVPDAILCAVGVLGDQQAAQSDAAAASLILRSNFEGPALLIEGFASRLAAQGRGTIIGISSVAGDRGRASNYWYGAAKAGFSAYLSGLRNRLAKQGVHVVTVKPGFVRTRMTEGMALPPALTAAPADVALAIHRAVVRRRNVIYVRPIWRLIMLVIRAVPEAVFKRLSL